MKTSNASKQNRKAPPPREKRSNKRVPNFTVRHPLWSLCVDLFGLTACLVVVLIYLIQGYALDVIFWGFAAFGVLAILATYEYCYERLTLKDGVYKAYHAFKKNQSANVDAIELVAFVHKSVRTARYGTVSKQCYVIFEDKDENVLIQFRSHASIQENDTFLRSLRAYRIQYIFV